MAQDPLSISTQQGEGSATIYGSNRALNVFSQELKANKLEKKREQERLRQVNTRNLMRYAKGLKGEYLTEAQKVMNEAGLYAAEQATNGVDVTNGTDATYNEFEFKLQTLYDQSQTDQSYLEEYRAALETPYEYTPESLESYKTYLDSDIFNRQNATPPMLQKIQKVKPFDTIGFMEDNISLKALTDKEGIFSEERSVAQLNSLPPQQRQEFLGQFETPEQGLQTWVEYSRSRTGVQQRSEEKDISEDENNIRNLYEGLLNIESPRRIEAGNQGPLSLPPEATQPEPIIETQFNGYMVDIGGFKETITGIYKDPQTDEIVIIGSYSEEGNKPLEARYETSKEAANAIVSAMATPSKRMSQLAKARKVYESYEQPTQQEIKPYDEIMKEHGF